MMSREGVHRNQLKSLLGIETRKPLIIPIKTQNRNQLKSLLGIETCHRTYPKKS